MQHFANISQKISYYKILTFYLVSRTYTISKYILTYLLLDYIYQNQIDQEKWND